MSTILAASYYPRTAKVPALVVLEVIVDGRRQVLAEKEVRGRAEARRIAEQFGFDPHNF